MPCLRWIGANGRGQLFPIYKSITTLGSAGGNDVLLPAPGVASWHAQIVFDGRDFALDESIVFLRPAAGGPLARAFAAKGKVYANLAFGGGAYGPTTLYLALLAFPPFTADTERGLERVRVEVGGAPIPPLAEAL